MTVADSRPLAAFVVVAAAVTACAQIVQGRVDCAGFQTSTACVIRSGQWFPLVVSLQSQGRQVFTGVLQVETRDLDGDRIVFTQPQVTLTGDVGPPKRIWCYATVNAVNELPPGVTLVGASEQQQGGLVTELPLPATPIVSLAADDLLVLDISQPPVAALESLQTPNWSPGQSSEGIRRFYRNVVITRMPEADLPDRWWGLEAVDVLVWDQPNPAALSTAQRDAVIAWVRSGGQLIVGVGPTWGVLAKSDLAAIMPLAGEGETQSLRALALLPTWLSGGLSTTQELHDPLPVTSARTAPGAFRLLGEYGPGNEPISMITMRLAGSGRVLATAAGLRDLTNVLVKKEEFLAALMDLNAYSDEYLKNQRSMVAQHALPTATWLYDDFVEPVDFRAASALRGLAVFLFVAVYVLAATLGSWWWLRGHGAPRQAGASDRSHWSWPVFAGFAVLASAVGLATVSALRGLSRGVQSLQVIDLEAGTNVARGFCAFGYRSPIRQRVNLVLPGEGSFLRPLARNPRVANYYVTPARYASLPARARLEDVLMRATLKQVEGFWHGDVDGTLRANLVVDRQTGRFSRGSWIANDLTVRLDGGYLLLIDPRLDDGTGVPWRAADLTGRYELPASMTDAPDSRPVPPAVNVLAVRVPPVPAGQQVTGLGQADYEQVGQAWVRRAQRRDHKGTPMLDLRTLWAEQQGWADNSVFSVHRGGRGGLPDPVRAVLLASTRNCFLSNRSEDFNSVGMPVRTDGLPDLEISHWLVRGQAVLLCWSSAPGPARLYRNGRPVDAYRGVTVYRVRLPLRYQGHPPGGSTL